MSGMTEFGQGYSIAQGKQQPRDLTKCPVHDHGPLEGFTNLYPIRHGTTIMWVCYPIAKEPPKGWVLVDPRDGLDVG